MRSEAALPEYIYTPMGLRPVPAKLAPEVHPLHGPYHRITWRAKAKSPYFPGETWDEEYTYLSYVVDVDERPVAIVWMRVDDEDSDDAIEALRAILGRPGALRVRRGLSPAT